MNYTGNHKGGRDNTCPVCSLTGRSPSIAANSEVMPYRCRYYNKNGTLTRYAFSCGYIEKHANLNLHMRHGVFHVDGQDINGNFVNKSFDTVKPARAFLQEREDEQITRCNT